MSENKHNTHNEEMAEVLDYLNKYGLIAGSYKYLEDKYKNG